MSTADIVIISFVALTFILILANKIKNRQKAKKDGLKGPCASCPMACSSASCSQVDLAKYGIKENSEYKNKYTNNISST